MIVLIAGWAGFRASLLPLELALRWRLRRPVVRADVGLGFGCIRESAERLARQLAKIARGERVDIVGYSMGGLIATHLLKKLDRGEFVRSVITLGTPHRGSPTVLLARGVLDRLSSSLAQMLPDSDFLSELAARDVPLHSRLVSIASLGDGVVPVRYAELPRRPRQFTSRISGVSHLGLPFSRAAIDGVEAWIRRPELRLVS